MTASRALKTNVEPLFEADGMVAVVAGGLHKLLIQLVLHLRLFLSTTIVIPLVTWCFEITVLIPARAIQVNLTSVIISGGNKLRVVNFMSVLCG